MSAPGTNNECLIDNVFLDYTIKEIESVFNKHYNIYHHKVVVVTELNHCLHLESIVSFSLINEIVLIDNNTSLSTRDEICKPYKSPTLFIYLKAIEAEPGDFPNLVLFPFNASFQTTESGDRVLMGGLIPKVELTNQQYIFKNPANITISEFDSN
jgi:hypothetical protein